MNARRRMVLFIECGVLAMALSVALLHPPTAQAAAQKKKPATSALAGAVCTTGTCTTGADVPAEGDRKLGTEITWMTSPDEAWRAAADQDKLVFMIQVSGNFARQEFT